jgi:fatty-acyl-CoA synthase
MPEFTPTLSGIVQRRGDFATVAEALDYAAQGDTGLNFYSVRGELTTRLPYRDLAAEARGLARRLLGAGLTPGERVAIVAETKPDFVRAFFACQYAGLIPAPLPLPTAFGGRAGYVAHIRRLVIEADAVALFATEPLLGWLRPIIPETGVRLCGTIAELDAILPAEVLPTVGPDAVAYLQFSSGSTRFPIGVVVHQRALMANVAAILTHGLQLGPTDRAVSWLPLYHDMGMVGFLLTPLAGQLSVDLLATADFARRPHLWLTLMAEHRATTSYSPSFGYDLCTRRERKPDEPPLDLSSWRVAGIGGDMIRPAVLDAFAAAFAASGFSAKAFLPSYGMAEATLAIAFGPIGHGVEIDTVDLDRLEQDGVATAPASANRRSRDVVLCGAALPGHEIDIRDATGRTLPDRRVGRILVRGPSLMRGYDGRAAETEAVLSPEGWLDTGDLGYRLGASLVITGRAKDLIIINGRNIWPQDLEWTIEQEVPQIRSGNVAAFSIEEDGHEVLILAAETRALASGGGREMLMSSIGDSIRAQHGLEGRVLLLPANTLPYTSSGKLSRSAIRQRYLAGTLLPAAVPA